MALPENVSDPGAGNNFYDAATHPYLEAQLELLPAPDFHSVVVVAQLRKPVLPARIRQIEALVK